MTVEIRNTCGRTLWLEYDCPGFGSPRNFSLNAGITTGEDLEPGCKIWLCEAEAEGGARISLIYEVTRDSNQVVNTCG